MKFGTVENPDLIDFSIPPDHTDTFKVLQSKGGSEKFKVYVGCAKWNKQDLKGFYPKGVKDELTYYSTQFNSIELNATFYQRYNRSQFEKWYHTTPPDFKFFPKINQYVSHLKRLKDVGGATEEFCNAVVGLEDKLGMVFLQLHDNFKPNNYNLLEDFVLSFPKGIPLAVELRNTEWFNHQEQAEKVYQLFEKENITNIIVDSAGRRDLLHMRLTTPTAFIRYVGANHPSDYSRLDPWIERLKTWREQGLNELYFFLHQNEERESPALAAYFIEKMNPLFDLNLKVPELIKEVPKGKSVPKDKKVKTEKRKPENATGELF